MKIGDVEYQGDGNKAIFYYIADERVDFRQLIKVLAEAFRVRIEMKQIGARQEAGRIGGIGPCGRELCCATWMTNFVSVSTSAARYQDISLNPQKLAGQCAKLKCCLNYEVDAYVECQKRLPSKEITLETADATYYYFKADILEGTITYSTDKNFLANEVTIPAKRAFEIINKNKQGEKPAKLSDEGSTDSTKSKDLLEQESVTRFDKSKNKKKKKKGGENRNNNNPEAQARNNAEPKSNANGNATSTAPQASAQSSKKAKNKGERTEHKGNEAQKQANAKLPVPVSKQPASKKLPMVAKASTPNPPSGKAENNGNRHNNRNRNNRRPKGNEEGDASSATNIKTN